MFLYHIKDVKHLYIFNEEEKSFLVDLLISEKIEKLSLRLGIFFYNQNHIKFLISF